ncbi:MAG: carboxypeptidase regulatory-like domain-containing protein [Bacteroidales bacterium]|nr:carboxypeptidase regulatory-like domain-containing protein [Bacteroidales bacterium]
MRTNRLIWGVLAIFALCLMTSCVKEISTGDIQGIVTNANTNEPIQGVNISLSPTGLSTVTGSDGRYEFNNLTAGQYTVQGVKNGFESNTKSITIVSGNISSGDMTLKPLVSGFRLSVEYLDFGTTFSNLSFKIINASTTLPMSWEIMESLNWLTVQPSTGNLNGGQEVTVQVAIDRSLITQNTTGNITVRSADQTIVLPVNVSVSGESGPHLQLSETSLDFGTVSTSLPFYVMNTGPSGTSLNWNCSNINVDWLTLSPMSGNTAGGASTQVTATIDRSKFTGVVSTAVTVTGAGSSATITFNATSSGSGTPILALSVGSIDFGEEATTKTFQVQNTGSAGTTLNWTIVPPTVDWLVLNPMSGTTSAGSGSLVTAIIDRTKINGPVATSITVNGNVNSSTINVSATYVDNSVVVNNGLYCYFTFDDDNMTDYTGNFEAIYAGTTTSTDTPGNEGRSLDFDGNSFMMVTDNFLPSTNIYSINLWFKTGRNDQFLIGSSTGDYRYSYFLTNTSSIEYLTSSNYSARFATNSIASYLNNQWHMLTVTINGSLAMIYLDGVLFETATNDNFSWSSEVNATYLGTNSNSAKKYNGKIDNFRTYNRALSASEVQTLFNAKQ